MNQQYAHFNELPLRTEYTRNGNHCIKQSSRTVALPDYSTWFYAGMHELCTVNAHSRLAADYFDPDYFWTNLP